MKVDKDKQETILSDLYTELRVERENTGEVIARIVGKDAEPAPGYVVVLRPAQNKK